MVQLKQIAAGLVLSVIVAVSHAPIVLATDSKSTNYGVSEVHFGSGEALRSCSSSYCAKQTLGDLTVGNTKSANYQAQAGNNNNREPFLNVTVTAPGINMGYLTPTTTGTGTAAFSVKTYLASGYNVYISGTSPVDKSSGHVLSTMSTAGASQQGIEQFGINLRANTTPVVGTDPVQVPSSTFSFGTPTSAYNTPNSFKYLNGDIIASSNSSSGETDYTMSTIANVTTNTAAGQYQGRLVINVIPTF